jgi:hypothetical protein
MGVERGVYAVLVGGGELRETDYVEVLRVDGRTILKRIFKEWNCEAWPRVV